jgi:nucleoid DNA-binding protein
MGVNCGTLARSIAPLLGEGYVRDNRQLRKVVMAMAKVMGAALQQGETITIRGLGKFVVREKPARRRSVAYFYKQANKNPTFKTVLLPPKKYVHFTPCPSINAALEDPCSS